MGTLQFLVTLAPMASTFAPHFAIPPRKILLVRLSHLGDACHALAVFHQLRATFPEAELHWAIQPEFAGLLTGVPGLTGVVLFDRKGGVGAWLRVRKSLRKTKFDLTVDAQGNWKSGMLSRLSGAPTRVGMAAQDWREKSAARTMTHHAAAANGPHAMHRMGAICQFIQSANLKADLSEFAWDLPLTESEKRAGHELLSQWLSNDTQRQRRILHLATPDDPRSWPGESYAQLARSLAQSGESVLCLSGPSEESVGDQVRNLCEGEAHVTHLVGQRGLRELASMLWAAGQDGVRLLACDSGPSHVAAAVGMAVDLLAGPTDPDHTGPWPSPPEHPGHRILKSQTLEALKPETVHDWLRE